ncbi:hypothetical protein [Halopseudomonas aestusnigri]|uniref:hypothetical protein n=1 Tax=Halopseudomonas aestusnigri TaxID=857252 RepID=UPI0028C1B708|nr:hypothetical protein YSKK_34050 [Halopseudomonas aestusnigri]
MDQPPFDQDDFDDVRPQETGFDLAPALIGWGIAALAFAIFIIINNTSPLVTSASLPAKIFAVIVGAALGTGAALVGDALRRAVMPSAVYTQGGFFSLLWIKVFWKVGPQVIGLLIGVFLGTALVLQ